MNIPTIGETGKTITPNTMFTIVSRRFNLFLPIIMPRNTPSNRVDAAASQRINTSTSVPTMPRSSRIHNERTNIITEESAQTTLVGFKAVLFENKRVLNLLKFGLKGSVNSQWYWEILNTTFH